MRVRINIILACLMLMVGGFIGMISSPQPAYAEENETPAKWIQISPVSKKLDLVTGERFSETIKVTNIGSETLSFRVYANPYFVQDVTSEPIFETESSYTQIARWVGFDQTEYNNVAPGEVVEVPYYLDVPADAPSGGQYAVIFAETLGDATSDITNGSSIETVSRVGSLIYAHLAGSTRLQGEIVSVSQESFFSTQPIVASSIVQNDGNVDFSVQHKFTVNSIFGNEIFSETKNKTVLPGISAQTEVEWEGPLFGVFNISNQISFLGSAHYDETKLVLICPLWLLIMIVILVALLLVSVVTIVVRTIRNKRRSKS